VSVIFKYPKAIYCALSGGKQALNLLLVGWYHSKQLTSLLAKSFLSSLGIFRAHRSSGRN